jgi:ABC-type dipeptide/oligopeptide/nickel transport system ATPase component
MTDNLLEIENLSVHFHIPEGVARAVDGISFDLAAGETIGLVGESGCGKSVTSLSILGLIPSPREPSQNSWAANFDDISRTDDLTQPGTAHWPSSG